MIDTELLINLLTMSNDKVSYRYWSKIVIVSQPFAFDAPVRRVPVGILS